jgi:uncharacterized protein GlcG (DUF336 family)
MSAWMKPIAALGLVVVLASPAGAQLLARKDLSMETALTIAQTAAAMCKGQGYNVSVHVVGRNGEVIVALRGDNASPHTFENSLRKAFTSRTFRVASGEYAKRTQQPGGNGSMFLTGVIAAQGGLPIMVGNDVIGAVAVSGSPGGDKDEACSKAGIDKVADQLK